MMFGTREEFVYEQCSDCGSLQIAEIPSSEILARHYPANYYSFKQPTDSENSNPKKSFRRVLRDQAIASRDLSALGIGSSWGAVLDRIRPASTLLRILAAAEVRISDKILDVGCGMRADLLNRLAQAGFENLLGIDPFIETDVKTSTGVNVLKKDIRSIHEKFDLVMFHHSFEHVPDPRATLKKARDLLQIGGRCLIRIPTPSSEAYEKYGNNWVQLDAPRHLVLASRRGIETLATGNGFSLERVVDDSWSFQFTASELYMRNIPLTDQRPADVFGAQAIREYDKLSKRLNIVHRGDQAAFILRAV